MNDNTPGRDSRVSKNIINNNDIINQLWFRFKKIGDEKNLRELMYYYLPVAKYHADRIAAKLPLAVRNRMKDDLYIEAMAGLVEAINRFEITMDVKFETFASKRVRGSILDSLRNEDILPQNVRKKAKQIENAYFEIEAKEGRPAKDHEVMKKLGIAEKDFYVSLDMIKGIALISRETDLLNKNGEKFLIEEIIGSDMNVVAEIERREAINVLAGAIDMLEDVEKKLLQLYYWDELTMQEIGKVLDLTESRICQMHTKCILKLKGLFARYYK